MRTIPSCPRNQGYSMINDIISIYDLFHLLLIIHNFDQFIQLQNITSVFVVLVGFSNLLVHLLIMSFISLRRQSCDSDEASTQQTYLQTEIYPIVCEISSHEGNPMRKGDEEQSASKNTVLKDLFSC